MSPTPTPSAWRLAATIAALSIAAIVALHLGHDLVVLGYGSRLWLLARSASKVIATAPLIAAVVAGPAIVAALRGKPAGPGHAIAGGLLWFILGIAAFRSAGVPGSPVVSAIRLGLAGAVVALALHPEVQRRAAAVAGSTAAACLVLLGVPSLQSHPSSPHVLMISVDTLRPDRMSLYGYERQTTPHLDALFADATVFDRALSSAPCTDPAILQTLTGRRDYARHAPRIAELLASAGFATAAFTTQAHFSDMFGADPDHARGFDHFEPNPRRQAGATADFAGSWRTADGLTDDVLSWTASQGDRPAFVWVHYYDPHDAYEPPEPWRKWDQGSERYPTGDRRTYLKEAGVTPEKPAWQMRGDIFDETDVAHFSDLYDGEIGFTDQEIGRLVEGLESSGWLNDATILFWSDHGEFLGEDDWWDHCVTLRPEVIRVPLAIRTANGALPGADAHQLASTLDLAPTLLAQLGLPIPEGLEGQDLSTPDPDRILVSHWAEWASAWSREHQLVVDSEQARLIEWGDGAGTDRSEDHPDARKQLETALNEDPQAAALMERTAATLEALRAIGYVE